MNLYDISKSMNELINSIPEDPTTEEVEELQGQFLKMDGDFSDKVENTIKYMKNLEGDIAAIDNEIERLQAKKNPLINKCKRLEGYIDNAMLMAGRDTLNTTIAKVSYKNSTKCIIFDESLIPEEYKVTETITKIPKANISKLLKDNKEVPGARLDHFKNLQIK